MFMLAEAKEWSDLLQPALEVMLTVITPVLASLVAAWLVSLREKIKAEIDAKNLEFLRDMAVQLVVAAEQSGLIGDIEDVGEAKKEMVTVLLQRVADSKGIKIDVEVLSAIIESAVVDVFDFSDRKELEIAG